MTEKFIFTKPSELEWMDKYFQQENELIMTMRELDLSERPFTKSLIDRAVDYEITERKEYVKLIGESEGWEQILKPLREKKTLDDFAMFSAVKIAHSLTCKAVKTKDIQSDFAGAISFPKHVPHLIAFSGIIAGAILWRLRQENIEFEVKDAVFSTAELFLFAPEISKHEQQEMLEKSISLYLSLVDVEYDAVKKLNYLVVESVSTYVSVWSLSDNVAYPVISDPKERGFWEIMREKEQASEKWVSILGNLFSEYQAIVDFE